MARSISPDSVKPPPANSFSRSNQTPELSPQPLQGPLQADESSAEQQVPDLPVEP
jgi:hypothetical protein